MLAALISSLIVITGEGIFPGTVGLSKLTISAPLSPSARIARMVFRDGQ
jgi:hypothetical protein